MDYDKLVEKIKERMEDLNYLANHDKSSEILNYSWRYARAELQIVLNMINNLDK